MNDINNPLEDIKVKEALRAENIKLKYRKSYNPKEINILDYTVIAALEKQLLKPPEHKVHPKYPALGKNYYCSCGVMFVDFKRNGTNYCGNCGQKLMEETK